MLKLKYQSKRFHQKTLDKIHAANVIIQEYHDQGYTLTLRQLYYQMVARALLPNNVAEYKKLGSTITDARLAGLVAWDVIEDRTRPLRGNIHWNSPNEAIRWLRDEYYHIDKWKKQPFRVEVWIEKDALLGVIQNVCNENDVHYMSSRGYPSMTAVWRASNRANLHKTLIILHLTDHDPSGIDMTRDLQDRLNIFIQESTHVDRIALTMEQVEQYQPPPNPAKMADSRYDSYVHNYGMESWELDALDPSTIIELIEDKILSYRNDTLWDEAVEEENRHLKVLGELTNDTSTLCEEGA